MSHESIAPAADLGPEPAAAPPSSDAWHGWSPFSRDPALRDDPFPIFKRIREQHPVHATPLGYYRVMRHADVQRVLKDLEDGVRTTDGKLPGVDGSVLPRSFMLMEDPPNQT